MRSAKGVRLPAALARHLRDHPAARRAFEAWRPSCQRDAAAAVAAATTAGRRREVVAREVGKAKRFLRRHPGRVTRGAGPTRRRGRGPAT